MGSFWLRNADTGQVSGASSASNSYLRLARHRPNTTVCGIACRRVPARTRLHLSVAMCFTSRSEALWGPRGRAGGGGGRPMRVLERCFRERGAGRDALIELGKLLAKEGLEHAPSVALNKTPWQPPCDQLPRPKQTQLPTKFGRALVYGRVTEEHQNRSISCDSSSQIM